MRNAVTLAVCALCWAGPAFSQQAKTFQGSDGKSYLQTASGVTLYVHDADENTGGGSACEGPCTKVWPPFGADANAKPNGDWTVLKRKDGMAQWVYKGRPLYTFIKDRGPGQRNGNAYGGNSWHVATP